GNRPMCRARRREQGGPPMRARFVFRGVAAALCAGALFAVLAVSVSAQAVPVRVVQGSDGTLYLVQGGSAWLLVPDQLSDADLANLTLGGEVDGAIPSEWLAAPAPPAPVEMVTAPPAPLAPAAAPPAPAAAPPVAAATAPPSPTAAPPAGSTPSRRAL